MSATVTTSSSACDTSTTVAPSLFRLADDVEHLRCLVPCQPGGRLVHHDQIRAPRECAHHLDLLLVGRTEVANGSPRREVEAGALAQLGIARVEATSGDDAPPTGLDAEEDVLDDGARLY